MMEALSETDFRYDAILVDEGQDFEAAWWVPLDELLNHPGEDPFTLLHWQLS